MALAIPMNLERIDPKELLQIAKEIPPYLKESIDRQIEANELEQQYLDRQEQLEKLHHGQAISDAQFKLLKKREELYKVYDKWVIRGRYFQESLKGFKDIVKGLSQNWLSILGVLLFMLFDPSGTLLMSLIDIFVNVGVMLIDLFATYAPKIIVALITVLTVVLPTALKKIIAGIFPALGKMFKDWAKQLQEDSPIISWIFDTIGNAFSKDGILYKFFMWMADNLPILAGLFIAVKLGIIGWNIAMWASVPANAALTASLWGMISAALSAALPFIALIAIFVLIYKFSDQIVGFFESLFKWFQNLSAGGKLLVGALALVLWPITTFAGIIYGLAKLFQSFKKIGVKETFVAIYNGIKEFASSGWNMLKNSSIGQAVGGAASWVAGKASDAGSFVMEQLDRLGRWLDETFMTTLMKIGAWFTAVAMDPFRYFVSGKGDYKEKIQDLVIIRNIAQEKQKQGKALSPEEVKIASMTDKQLSEAANDTKIAAASLTAAAEAIQKSLKTKSSVLDVTTKATFALIKTKG